MNLSLKSLQDTGVFKCFSDKEKDKHIARALAENAKRLETGVAPEAKSKETVLVSGGKSSVRVQGKRYNFSVFTPADMNLASNASNLNEQGICYHLPPMYRYHAITALGNTIFISAKTHMEAQRVCDDLLGAGRYTVSSSRI